MNVVNNMYIVLMPVAPYKKGGKGTRKENEFYYLLYISSLEMIGQECPEKSVGPELICLQSRALSSEDILSTMT